MSYKIETIEKHTAEMEQNTKDNIRRLDCDVSDVALSSWASDTMISFAHFAIEALKLGAENGIDGPAGYFNRLMQGERVVDAKLISGQYGMVWLLSDSEAATFGRKFIPFSGRGKSSVQKKLGLSETEIVAKASRNVQSFCGFIGGCVTFRLVEAK